MITYSQLTEAADLSELWHVTKLENAEIILSDGYLGCSPVKRKHFSYQMRWPGVKPPFNVNKEGKLWSISFTRSPKASTFGVAGTSVWFLFDRDAVKNTRGGKLVPFVDQRLFNKKARGMGSTESEERLVFSNPDGKLPLKPALKGIYIIHDPTGANAGTPEKFAHLFKKAKELEIPLFKPKRKVYPFQPSRISSKELNPNE